MATGAIIEVKDWQRGIAESPALGFSQMINVDIFSKPGVLKISRKLEPDSNSGSLVTELIIWFVQDPNGGDAYGVDQEGTLYKRDAGNGLWSIITGHGTTGTGGYGLGIWKDYLFYARSTKLDVYGPLSGTPAWTNDWQTLLTPSPADYHPMMSAQDDFLYIGNAQYLDVINEATPPFDPATPGSYTYNAQDLELRSDYRVNCLEELGSDIAIGTVIGFNSNLNIADTFFWDGASDSFSLNKTIRFAENGVWLMKNGGNVLYTVAGLGVPRLFESMTARGVEVRRFNNIDIPAVNRLRLFPAAIDQKDGEILLGIGRAGGVNGINPMGVYSYRNLAYSLRHLISTLQDGSNDNVMIGAIKMISAERFLVSWEDDFSGTFGIDILSPNFYTDYTARVDCHLYTIGTEADPTTPEKIEINMMKPLADGEGVKVMGRRSLTDTFVEIATFDTPTYLGRSNFRGRFSNLSQLQQLQLQILLTSDPESEESPELKEIIIT